MMGRTLTLGALVALTQAKAIITNNCPYDVYIWSVPQSGSSHTASLPVKSGGHYEEAWRHGTTTNPGIAIKISPQPDGIFKGGEELDFAYSIAGSNKSKVWVDLSAVRGKTFNNIVSFNTCHGSYNTADVATRQCKVSDNIELILCGAAATKSAKVITSTSTKVVPSVSVGAVSPTAVKVVLSISSNMTQCYIPTASTKIPSSTASVILRPGPPKSLLPKVNTVKLSLTLSKSSTFTTYSTTTLSQGTPPKVIVTQNLSPKPSTVESYRTTVLVTSKSVYASPSAVTSISNHAALGASTMKPIYSPPGPVTDKVKYPAPEPLTGIPKHLGPGPSLLKPGYPPAAAATMKVEYPAPGASTAKPIYAPPGPVTDKAKYPVPEPTTRKQKYSGPGNIPSKPEYAPPGPASSSVQYVPPTHASAKSYSPPEPIDDYSGPPRSSEDYAHPPPSTSVKPTYAQPSYPSDDSYAPPAKSKEYSGPTKPTADHTPPHFSGKPGAPAKPAKGPSYFSEAPHGPSKPSKAPPAYTSEDSYVAPAQTTGYAAPLKPTANHGPPAHFSGFHETPVKPAEGRPSPPKPTGKPSSPYHTPQGRHGPSKHTAGQSNPPKVTPGYARSSSASTTKKGYVAPPKETNNHGPPHNVQYHPSGLTSQEKYGPIKATSGPHHGPPAHGPPTTISKVYNAPSTPAAFKPYHPVKEHGHGSPKVTSNEPAYPLPSPTGHGPPRGASGKPEYSPQDDEDEEEEEEDEEEFHAPFGPPTDESEYPAPKPSKSQPQHPHSPPSKPTTEKAYSPSKGPAHPFHAKSTQPSHKTTIGKPYPSPPEPTYGDEHSRVKRLSTMTLGAVIQREAAKITRQNPPRACFSWFHEPSLPGMSRADAQELLGANFLIKGKSFSDLMNTNTTECPILVPRMHEGRFGVCMKPLCAKMGGNCSDLEDDLESATKAAFDKDLDYTTDDDICV